MQGYGCGRYPALPGVFFCLCTTTTTTTTAMSATLRTLVLTLFPYIDRILCFCSSNLPVWMPSHRRLLMILVF